MFWAYCIKCCLSLCVSQYNLSFWRWQFWCQVLVESHVDFYVLADPLVLDSFVPITVFLIHLVDTLKLERKCKELMAKHFPSHTPKTNPEYNHTKIVTTEITKPDYKPWITKSHIRRVILKFKAKKIVWVRQIYTHYI